MTNNASVRITHTDQPAPFAKASDRRGHVADGGETLAGQDAAERIVRDFMVEEMRKTGADRLPELAPAETEVTGKIKAKTQKKACVRRQQWHEAVFDDSGRDQLDRLAQVQAEPRQAETPMGTSQGQTKRIVGLARGIRLGRGAVMAMLLVLLVIWKPGLVLTLIGVPVVLAAIAYLTVGHDRIAEISAESWRKFEARRPKRAETLRAKADALALKWDMLLDHLPESWAERLALPDLSASNGTTLRDAPDPFERLAREARND
jgi:hypothetical protein